MDVDATRVHKKLEEVAKDFERVGRRAQDSARGANKDWFGVANLFSDIMPRGLSRTIRKFQSTTRSVGRLSKGFGKLKGAIVATGIGALIVALGLLVQNWDKVSEALSGVTAKQKRFNATSKAGREAVQEMTLATENYLSVVNDASASLEERQAAQSELSKVVREAAEYDIDSAEGLERLNRAVELNIELTGLQEEMTAQRQQLRVTREQIEASRELQSSWYSFILDKKGMKQWELDRISDLTEGEEELKDMMAAQLVVVQEQTAERKRLTEETQALAKAEREEAEALREAEAERKRIAAEKQRSMEYEAALRGELDQYEELRTLDKHEREERLLMIAHTRRVAAAAEEIQDQEKLDEALLRLDMKFINDQKAMGLRHEEEDRISGLRTHKLKIERSEAAFQDFLKRGMAEQAWKDDQAKLDLDRIERSNKAQHDSQMALLRASAGVMGQLSDLAEENSDTAKALAITEVLLAQAVAVSNAIAGATTAATATGPAAFVTTPLFIAQMVGTVLSAFAGVKNILSDAGAGDASIGDSAPNFTTRANIPNTPQQQGFNNPWEGMNVQTYVVQSQLAAQQAQAERINGMTVL